MLSRLPALFVTLGVLACGTTTPSPTEPEYSLAQAADSIPLPSGVLVHVGDVWMSLSDVPAESRCPKDVVCVQAGDATAQIVVHPPCYKDGCKAASFMLALHINTEPRSGDAWGFKTRLVALTPEPLSTRPTDKTSYVAWVRVTK